MSFVLRNFSAGITAPCNTLRTLANKDFWWRKNCWWRCSLTLGNATARKRSKQPQQVYVTLTWWQQPRRYSYLFRCSKIMTANVREQIPFVHFQLTFFYGIRIRFILYKNVKKLRHDCILTWSSVVLCVRFSTRQHLSVTSCLNLMEREKITWTDPSEK
jgi:hypothetical protein